MSTYTYYTKCLPKPYRISYSNEHGTYRRPPILQHTQSQQTIQHRWQCVHALSRIARNFRFVEADSNTEQSRTSQPEVLIPKCHFKTTIRDYGVTNTALYDELNMLLLYGIFRAEVLSSKIMFAFSRVHAPHRPHIRPARQWKITAAAEYHTPSLTHRRLLITHASEIDMGKCALLSVRFWKPWRDETQ